MCSMIEFEMFLHQSPPVFSHSPPTSFLSDFAALHLSPQLQRSASCRQTQKNCTANYAAIQRPFKSPKRPCLVIRPNDESCSSGDEDPASPTKPKKKVVFADDRGMSLTHVRVMTEPSGVPPLWSTKFLAEVTRGLTAEAEVQHEPWEITFCQPASDYISFRQKLSDQKVCLENVVVREAKAEVVGTVKVQNISFHKEVIMRCSFDNWKTHEDNYCTYVVNNIAAGTTYIVFDTFSFKINLTPKARKLEFCVCFRCDGQEYWDNNCGKNYIVVKKAKAPLRRSSSDNTLFGNKNNDKVNSKEIGNKYPDAARAKLDTWSQFASWNHLENSAPYW